MIVAIECAVTGAMRVPGIDTPVPMRNLVVACAALFAADAFYHKHVVFEFEEWFGFFGLFGFFMSFALVLAAREMRKVLMKDEDFYDR